MRNVKVEALHSRGIPRSADSPLGERRQVPGCFESSLLPITEKAKALDRVASLRRGERRGEAAVLRDASLKPSDPSVRLQPIDRAAKVRARQPIERRKRRAVDDRVNDDHLRVPVAAAPPDPAEAAGAAPDLTRDSLLIAYADWFHAGSLYLVAASSEAIADSSGSGPCTRRGTDSPLRTSVILQRTASAV